MTMQLDVITLFPEMFSAVTDSGITRRAFENGLVSLNVINPRDFTEDRHRTVDDRPYGGGPGMVMLAEPLSRAIAAARQGDELRRKVIYVSPQGRRLDNQGVSELTKEPGLIFLAGRYEGVDERVVETLVDEEWSIGDYVLSGGELPVMVMMDALIRQLPGALGDELSAEQDSFYDGLLDCAHYSRPREFCGKAVPDVLLDGDHEKIRLWRLKQSLGRTWLRRPDLLERRKLSAQELTLLNEFKLEHGRNRSTET